MAQVNPLTREVLVKVVYYGPGLGGKTTSLQRVHAASPPETRGSIVSLATPVDRTLYFDFMPLRVPPVRGHPVRLQLFTVPGQVYFNATRKLLLTGADGVVFVADSQRDRQDANLESFQNLNTNLKEQGRALEDVPHVLQFNKRDLANVTSLDELDQALNPHKSPAFPTCATRGDNVIDALDALVRRVLEHLEHKQAFGVEVTPSPIRFARTEQPLDEHIGRASEQQHVWTDMVEDALSARKGDGVAASAVATSPPLGANDSEGAPTSPTLPMPMPVPSIEMAGSRAPGVTDRVGAPTLGHEERPVGPSFAPLFGPEADAVLALERDLAHGRLCDAIRRAEDVALRVIANTAAHGGLGEGARDPAIVAMCLGVEGARWLGFRRLVRRARGGGPVEVREALEAFALVVDLCLRRDRVLL